MPMETLLSIDDNLYRLVNSQLSNGFFDLILIPFRHKLFWIPLYMYLVTYVYVNYKKQAWLVFLGIIITILISDTISSKIIKKNVKRTRPCHVEQLDPVQRVPCSNGYSFTSSHATNHFAIGSFFFLLLSFTGYKWLFMLWAGIISFAQVYVGVHYPIDVICGAVLGILIGHFSFWVYNRTNERIYKSEKTIA